MLLTAEGEQLRAQVAGALNQAKPPKSNISKGERQALRTLAKEKSVTIFPADKGKATVIMDTAEYEEKVKEMLSDEKVYEVPKKDPTAVYKRKLGSILTRLKEENKITEGQYKVLYPTTENRPRMYCKPKIHKEGTQVCPIVELYRINRLQHFQSIGGYTGTTMGKTDHHVKNSQ